MSKPLSSKVTTRHDIDKHGWDWYMYNIYLYNIYIFVDIDIQSIPSIRIHSENSQGTGEGPGVYRRHQGTVDQNPKLVGLYTVYL